MIATAIPQPNSVTAIAQRINTGRITWSRPTGMLVIRLVLFAALQALIAGIYALQGTPNAWDASVPWWTVCATLTNIVCIFLLIALTRREGIRVCDLYRFERGTVKRDLLISLGLVLISAPLATLPSLGLGSLLFGDMAKTSAIMFRPLPQWVALLNLIAFPLSIAFSELPTYYGYVRPRLEALSGNAWLAVGLAVFFHAAQHCALPLVFDARFIVWRLGMFLLFAALLGITLRWRPSLFPYMMVVHGLLDLQVSVMMLMVS